MDRIKFLLATVIISFCIGAAAAQQPEYQLSSHILDISEGSPAAGVTVHLFRYNETAHDWDYVYQTKSGSDGRITDLLPSGNDNRAVYKLRFDTSGYFSSKGEKTIYPFIEVIFTIDDKTHYHIPVLISANGYSTYRGS